MLDESEVKPPFFPPFRPPKNARQRARGGEGGHAFCFSGLQERGVGAHSPFPFLLPPPYPPLAYPLYPPPSPPLFRTCCPFPFPRPPPPPAPPPPLPPPSLASLPFLSCVSSTASSLPLMSVGGSETKFKTLKSRLDETFISARSHPKPETLNPNPKPRTAKELVL